MMKLCAPFDITSEEVAHAAKMWGCDNDEAYFGLCDQRDRCRHYKDKDYEAIVNLQNKSGMVQVVVRRKDGRRIRNHWQVMLRIKNEVIGPKYFGYEVYPPADEVIDTANTYHLWCCAKELFNTYDRKHIDALR